MSAFPNQAKSRLTKGELSVGFILRQSRTADIAAIGKTCGFDWFSIDMEHSSIDVDTAAQLVSAALPIGITPLVRTPAALYPNATRLLDAGAQGLIVPHIDTAEEARFVVSYCRYPPLGGRSIASVQPQLGYREVPGREAMRLVDAEMLTIAMLETPLSIENAAEIASVPGIDVLLIGSNDLCAEMGIAGEFAHPALEQAYRNVAWPAKRMENSPACPAFTIPRF
jgi:4-hydroxy-2-oxoheptanedioate aldolase